MSPLPGYAAWCLAGLVLCAALLLLRRPVALLLRLLPLDCPASVYLAQQTEAIAHLDFHTALTISAVSAWAVWLAFLLLAAWMVKKSSGKKLRYGV